MLPSSPPLLPRSDTIPSSPPPLPTLSSYNSKKRRLSDYASQSSDPVFSEDPSEAELCSADSEPRKRQVRGPWWDLRKSKRVLPGPRAARRRHRNNDSGIWMQSDDSVASMSSQQSVSICEVPVREKAKETLTDAQRLVQDRIQLALDTGKEVIDLADCALEDLSSDLLKPLHQMIKQPHDHDNYRPLTPEVQLYLQGNALRSLPTELFRLSNLTVLSLRNNNLEALPPQIGQLHNLKELNVAGNKLRCLPWSLICLLRGKGPLDHITFFPNPAYRSAASDEQEAELLGMDEWMRNVGLWTDQLTVSEGASAISNIRFFDSRGRSILAKNATDQEYTECLFPQSLPSTNSIRSLFDIALQRIGNDSLADAAAALLPQHSPSIVHESLGLASFNAAAGSEHCSTCGKSMTIARAEWIEWWYRHTHVNKTTSLLVCPVMRRACSYACVEPTPCRGLSQQSDSWTNS